MSDVVLLLFLYDMHIDGVKAIGAKVCVLQEA